jgi:SAM-dependent methyltransferase
MGFKDHFSRVTSQYGEYRPSYPASLFEYLAGVCADRRAAWDCACGTGQATIALAEQFDTVIATDASQQQVAAATRRPNVAYRVARAEQSGIETGSLDLVTVAQALHWFDLDAFYEEVFRVLKPSGVLAVWTYNVLHVDDPACEALVQEFYYDTVGPYWPPERRLVEEGYRSLRFPFALLAVPTFDMVAQWSVAQLLGYMRTWSATGRYVEATQVDPVAALGERLAQLPGDANRQLKVTWPLALRAGRRDG